MSEHFTTRRYLLNFDTRQLGQVFTDVLVIGAGVAGLRAAIEAANQGAHVIVATKDDVPKSNTMWAQGGIAVVLDPEDSVESHVADTLEVGCGINDAKSVEEMARSGPRCLDELLSWGAAFDREGERLALGMEGGHSARRVAHASGDATGREVGRTLIEKARRTERVRIFEQCFLIDFVVDEGRCVAALSYHEKYGHQIIWAKQTILASGGAGRLYRESTNQPTATADGHAMAFRAGAKLRDMEFIQFHPTALYVAGASRALISEAVRGEGAYLVDRAGMRFMPDLHPRAELAPRDVVSRSIVNHLEKTGSATVYLDVRHFAAGQFEERFPNIANLCREFDIDVTREWIPVRPAAHYIIGGVAVDAEGRTTLDGLLACGEASSTGVHGANRLASNSLLEGLVFGMKTGRLAAELALADASPSIPRTLSVEIPQSPRTALDVPDVRNSLRAVCWRNLGIDRDGDRLDETQDILEFWARYVMDKVLVDRLGWETQNMLTVARCVALAAKAREESRGVHYRRDFPSEDASRFLGHFTLQMKDGCETLEFERFSS